MRDILYLDWLAKVINGWPMFTGLYVVGSINLHRYSGEWARSLMFKGLWGFDRFGLLRKGSPG